MNSNVFGMVRWRTVNCSLFVDVFHSQFETLVGVTTLIVLVYERTFTVLLMGGQVLYGSRLSLWIGFVVWIIVSILVRARLVLIVRTHNWIYHRLQNVLGLIVKSYLNHDQIKSAHHLLGLRLQVSVLLLPKNSLSTCISNLCIENIYLSSSFFRLFL